MDYLKINYEILWDNIWINDIVEGYINTVNKIFDSDKYFLLNTSEDVSWWLKEFYVINEWKKIWYFSYNIKKDKKNKKKKILKLYYLATSNWKKELEKLYISAPYLYKKVKSLDYTENKNLWKTTLYIFINYIKNNTKFKEFQFDSLNNKSNLFYNNILPILKEKWIIKSFSSDWNKYIVYL